MKKLIILSLLSLTLVGCTSSKEVKEVKENIKIEQLSEADKREQLNDITKSIIWNDSDPYKLTATFTNSTSFDIGMYDVYYQSSYSDGTIYEDTFTIVNLNKGESKEITMWRAEEGSGIEIVGSEYTE